MIPHGLGRAFDSQLQDQKKERFSPQIGLAEVGVASKGWSHPSLENLHPIYFTDPAELRFGDTKKPRLSRNSRGLRDLNDDVGRQGALRHTATENP